MGTMKVKMEFAYVYVVYYYDFDEQSRIARMHQVRPVACTSLERAKLFAKTETGGARWVEINPNLWQCGHLWTDRVALIDSFEHGLEFDVTNGSGEKYEGRMPLVFRKPRKTKPEASE